MRRHPGSLAVLAAASLIGLAACDDGRGSTTTPAPAPAPAPAPSPAPDEPPAQMVVSGHIEEDTTWVAATAYILEGAVFVPEGVTLTIEAGTQIYGESATNGTLIVERGGMLMAMGTADAPIVMTSDQEPGSRARGDWGGLILNGNAPLNIPGGVGEGEGDTGAYGGDDPADNSGVLNYVRVEYAGTEFSPDNELNGIAFQGVGNGTEVDYVQVHYNKDDGVEWFGGTVDAKHLVMTGIADDSFDWTEGWTGRGQFWIAQQRGDDADQGIEADNNAENNDLTPRSAPTLYNVTLIGDPGTEAGDESDIGMLLREGTAGEYANFIVAGFKDEGLRLDHVATYQQVLAGDLTVRNSIFHDNLKGSFGDGDGRGEGQPTAAELVALANVGGAGIMEVDPMLEHPYYHPGHGDEIEEFGVCPTAGSPALTGGAVPPADGFFDPVTYIGACDEGGDWFASWINLAAN
ncbi:MAG: hypothetical protein F4Y71_06420 [Acidobacteria bacterium]|nr:hypothetical protein [Acidobacteriota bacterium]MYG75342.1 hypothetical protein [Acidobacteriota bacterium]